MLAAFFVILVITSNIVENRLLYQRVEEQTRQLNEFSVRISGQLAEQDARTLYTLALEQGQGGGGRILITSPSGTVQVDSYSTLNGRRIDIREVTEVLTGVKDSSYGYHKIHREEGGSFWSLYCTSAVVHDGKIIGSVVSSQNIEDVLARTTTIKFQYIGVFLGALVLVILAAYLSTNHISKPLEELKDGAIRVASGDFSIRMKMKGKDEIAQVGHAFDYMTQKLENVDAQRSEFVSNASHELKTPMASMKILTESLLYQDGIPEEVYKDFLTDINTEIDRLTLLINDLLYLTKMENEELHNVKAISLVKLVEGAVRQVRPIADQKEIELTFEYGDNQKVECDALRLRQAVGNLIDNAVKYTPQGGRVEVYVYFAGGYATVTVKDTGVGISKEQLPHIFDRFYRVDKARARVTGGTGLGLHIVQRIALKHGGRVEVESEPGKGSAFRFIIPQKQNRLSPEKEEVHEEQHEPF